MASLKEIKGRISSVRSTLKITSAMKMVSSTKLHKAQQAAQHCALYEEELAKILSIAGGEASVMMAAQMEKGEKVALVACSSNSSLCGAFNANVIKKAKSVIESVGKENVVLYAVGRKMSESLAKEGLVSQGDWSEMAQHPSYAMASSLANELLEGWNGKRYSRVLLVWSHMVSTGHQEPSEDQLLPYMAEIRSCENQDDYIIEPGRKELYAQLLPQVIRLKLYSLLLDSNAAEHAARTVAMQTATDNGNEILSDLTLEYNKGRQAKITAEILDLAGGSQQQ